MNSDQIKMNNRQKSGRVVISNIQYLQDSGTEFVIASSLWAFQGIKIQRRLPSDYVH